MATVVCELAPRCTRPAVVEVVDETGDRAPGCHRCAVAALRGIRDARVYPLPGCDGAAIAVHREAFPGGAR